MAKKENSKLNKSDKRIPTDVVVLALVIIAIVVYIIVECISATNVEVQTITAVKSTVYETIDTNALVIRDEHIVKTDSSGVVVPCVEDGGKVKTTGNIAMVFNSKKDAKNYNKAIDLQEKLDYYIDLESKSTGVATDIESIDSDIIDDVGSYINSSYNYSQSSMDESSKELNDRLTRRQLIVGEKVDFSKVKSTLQKQLNAIDLTSCEPSNYITTDESGVFSSYTDGLEKTYNYDKVPNMTVKQFNKYVKKINSAKTTKSLGKLITTYEWYFCCKVSSEDVANINDGDTLEVALKNSDDVYQCEVVSGADLNLGTKQSVLVLKCSQMDAQVASMRYEEIEIRYDEHEGFKVPTSAIHVDKKGNKIVYALISNQVVARKSKMTYSTKDYAIFEYDPTNSDSIRLYDQIITQGKDLHDGKIYT